MACSRNWNLNGASHSVKRISMLFYLEKKIKGASCDLKSMIVLISTLFFAGVFYLFSFLLFFRVFFSMHKKLPSGQMFKFIFLWWPRLHLYWFYKSHSFAQVIKIFLRKITILKELSWWSWTKLGHWNTKCEQPIEPKCLCLKFVILQHL